MVTFQKNLDFTRLAGVMLFLGVLAQGCSPLPLLPTPQPVTLRFASLEDPGIYQALADEYMQANPHVTIETISPQGFRGDFDSILDQFAQVDLVRINSRFLTSQRKDFLQPLDEFMAIDRMFEREDYFPGALKALQIDGVQYGLPAGITPLVMYYDSLRLKIAQAEPPPPGYRLDEFLAYAALVHHTEPGSAEDALFSYGFCTHPESEDAIYLVYLMGGGLFDSLDNPTAATLDRVENVQALGWYAGLFEDYQLTPPAGLGRNEIYGLISGDKCGYWMGYLNQLRFLEERGMQVGFVPLPAGKREIGFSYLDSYFILKASQNPQEAYRFASFLSRRLEAANGSIPPLLSLINQEGFEQDYPQAAAIARQLPAEIFFIGLDLPEGERMGETLALFQQAVVKVIQGSLDPASALAEAQEKAEEIFK